MIAIQLTFPPIRAFFSIPTTKVETPFSVIETGKDLVREFGHCTVLTFMLSSVTGTWIYSEVCKEGRKQDLLRVNYFASNLMPRKPTSVFAYPWMFYSWNSHDSTQESIIFERLTWSCLHAIFLKMTKVQNFFQYYSCPET